jgi:hypothetical protein
MDAEGRSIRGTTTSTVGIDGGNVFKPKKLHGVEVEARGWWGVSGVGFGCG